MTVADGRRRKYAPYARELAARLATGDRPGNCVYVFVGSDAWRGAYQDADYEIDAHRGRIVRECLAAHPATMPDRDRPALILPPGENPRDFAWPVRGLECVIVPHGRVSDAVLNDLASELVLAGSPLVYIVDRDGTTFRPIEVADDAT